MPRSSSRPEKPNAVLSRAQGDDVLRYWLAALRLEEALQAAARARAERERRTACRAWTSRRRGRTTSSCRSTRALAELLLESRRS